MKLLVLIGICAVMALTGCAQKTPYGDGELAYAQGNYAVAKSVFAGYIGNDNPHRMEAMYYYGMCQAKLGDRNAADRTLRRAIRNCPDRALRARMMAGRAALARERGDNDRADAIFEDLRTHYYDVFSLEALETSRHTGVFTNPLQAEMATIKPAVSDTLYRVRLTATFGNKADALAESYRLRDAGIEAVVVPLPRQLYTVQIGAFRNPRLADAQMAQAKRLGWNAAIVK